MASTGVTHAVYAVEDAFHAPADRGESGQAEYRVETAEGIRYLKALVTAVYDPLGAALILRAVVQDATAGRTAELELDAVRAPGLALAGLGRACVVPVASSLPGP